jgi:superfamily II DNA or RNA helicase
MEQGIYESLISKLVRKKIESLNLHEFDFRSVKIDKAEAALVLSKHLAFAIKSGLEQIKEKEEDKLERQIIISNKLLEVLALELSNSEVEDDLIETEGKILRAVFKKTNSFFTDLDLHLKKVTPYTRLTQSELFTGGGSGLSMESELKKEILSSNRIDLLVSFIKWKGFRVLEQELREFTGRGGLLRVITTTYMGATDHKAIEQLSALSNTTVKVSYNTGNERLHAKAYLFYRNTGYHTAYIGSSNFSRTALTDGLEWNLKITTQEIPHIIDKFQKTFEGYWRDSNFETFEEKEHSQKLKEALQQGKSGFTRSFSHAYFDLKPYIYQKEILEQLEVERQVHNRYRNLIVAATGTGKTIISAFDFKKYKQENPSCKLLFIAHRIEILQQSLETFQAVLKDSNFGELWGNGNIPNSFENVFASIKTLNNSLGSIAVTPYYYDFIIVDEVHHITANSYRPLLDYFKPKVLVGLTATPERMDGGDILGDFDNRIAAEIRLPEAMNKKLLCPFQYFGITDNTDISHVKWDKGKYSVSELTKIYTRNDLRVKDILNALNKYCRDLENVKALGFCVNIEHANYMAEKFQQAGLRAEVLSSDNSQKREQYRNKLRKGEINYLFVVDIFNEGIDIPEIDTVLFLRPTESLTIFLQQLGRGLRLNDGKDCLTVLDFVANSRPEYDFEGKFRAMIGKTNSSTQKEVENNFPHLPLGCSIVLEKKAREFILENIKKASSLGRKQIIQKIRQFSLDTSKPLTLKNFIEFYHIPIELVYKTKLTWSRLCVLAEVKTDFDSTYETELASCIRTKWLSTASTTYFRFILRLAKLKFKVDFEAFSEAEKQMLLMLHYDFWQKEALHETLENSIEEIGTNPTAVNEISEVMEVLMGKIQFKEIDIELPYTQSLKVHARYTRDQILAAFQFSSFEKSASNREGIANNKELNTELLFIDLVKSEEDFSPTTMYDDYAITEKLFHWQSQNSTRNDSGKGLEYIHHEENNKVILLFLREQKKSEYNSTLGYVFIGKGFYQEHYGSKPMSITWRLEESIPNYLWKDSAKLG